MHFPIGIYRVRDRSMEPEFHDGDYVIVNRWPRRFNIGDVVVAEHPRKTMLLLKRVQSTAQNGYFLVGDNKGQSTDSRHFGVVRARSVIGKVIAKV